MRLFFAVEIPKDKCFYNLYQSLKELSKFIKPVDPDNQHITLKFLGDPGSTAEEVKGSVSRIGEKHKAFDLRVGNYGAFPNWKKPSVLWMGLSPVEPLSALANDIDGKIHEMIGLDLEKRRFRGHITVARYKGRMAFDTVNAQEIMEEVLNDLNDRDYHIPVNEFHLINSTLTPSGPVYRKISSFPLLPEKE